MDVQSVLKRLDRIDDLPTLPVIAMEVNRMLQDYDISVEEIGQTIEKDQAMVPRILKLVNSAFFGFQSEINNVRHALVLLGFHTVRNAIISISIIDAFSGKKVLEGFDITKFWTHSVAVAATSRCLAEKTRLHSPEDAFTAGLLHDIGKVILSQYLQDLFEKVWRSARENNLSFYDAEKKELKITHAQIGGYLARKWQLPAGLVDTIRYHHEVTKHVSDLNLLMVVHVGNRIVNSLMLQPEDELDLTMIHPDAVSLMKPCLDAVSDWFPEVSAEIQSACEFFLGEGG